MVIAMVNPQQDWIVKISLISFPSLNSLQPTSNPKTKLKTLKPHKASSIVAGALQVQIPRTRYLLRDSWIWVYWTSQVKSTTCRQTSHLVQMQVPPMDGTKTSTRLSWSKPQTNSTLMTLSIWFLKKSTPKSGKKPRKSCRGRSAWFLPMSSPFPVHSWNSYPSTKTT